MGVGGGEWEATGGRRGGGGEWWERGDNSASHCMQHAFFSFFSRLLSFVSVLVQYN